MVSGCDLDENQPWLCFFQQCICTCVCVCVCACSSHGEVHVCCCQPCNKVSLAEGKWDYVSPVKCQLNIVTARGSESSRAPVNRFRMEITSAGFLPISQASLFPCHSYRFLITCWGFLLWMCVCVCGWKKWITARGCMCVCFCACISLCVEWEKAQNPTHMQNDPAWSQNMCCSTLLVV